ncbi:hypothetical protein BDN70DRAFT_39171 [Pholiota conissans]|uniref:Pentatricopeptide repeat-containing protein-mitochondrial domain-containing protein n=1 Tax=Pholiota conissans TaxID=109636 RepID=A0A9P6CZM2_9AGAR|nr:hypothetical protein BDN70DRAFT_39171 [Pholiota conissans]
MLQRSYFTQKRHIDWTSVRSLSIYRQTSHVARCVFATSNQKNYSSSSTEGNKSVETIFLHLPEEVLTVVEDLRAHRSKTKVLQSIERSPELSSFFSNPRQTRKLVDAFARSSTPSHSLEVLKLAHSLGFTLKHQAYESACFHLGASRQWDSMLSIALHGKRHLGHTSVRLLNWRATALMETHQYALLKGILEEFKAARITPNQRTYHLILTGCIRNHDLEGCKRCLRDMKEAGFSPNATTHVLISKSYWQFGVDAEVRQNTLESLPELMPARRIMVINNLLQFYLEHHQHSTVLQLLSMFENTSTQIFMSFLSYEPKPETGVQKAGFFSAPAIGKIKPNPDTFAIFMNHQIKASNPGAAIRLWKAAATLGLSATPNVIAALIHAYFLQGRGNTAIRMVSNVSIEPKASEFEALMVEPIYEERLPLLNLSSPALTIRICNVLLKAILKSQGLAHVPDVFAIMHANNLRPNNRTLELLLSHINHREEPRPRTLFQLVRRFSHSNEPSSSHMHHIMSCVLRDEKRMFIDSAWKKRLRGHRLVHKHRRRVRLLKQIEDFDPMAGLDFTSHLSYDRMARPIMQSLTTRQVKSDLAMSFLRMRRDAALHLDTDSALDVFRALIARGLRPNEYHYGALLEGYALSGNFSSAKKVMAAATEAGITPGIVMYTTMIAAYAKHRNPTSALQTFREMVSAGLRPDVPSIDAVVSAFHAANEFQTARWLLIDLWSHIQPFPEALQDANMDTLITCFRQLYPYQSRGIQFPKPKRYLIYAHIKRILRAYKQYFTPYHMDISERDKNTAILGK